MIDVITKFLIDGLTKEYMEYMDITEKEAKEYTLRNSEELLIRLKMLYNAVGSNIIDITSN